MQDRYGDADDELAEAARLDPDDPDIFGLMGEVYQMREQYLLAAASFKKAVKLDPFDATFHADLGRVYASQGNREKAMQELRLAEQLALKDDFNTEQLLSLAYKSLHETPAAIEHYETLVRIGKKQGANPELVDSFEKALNELKSSLSPVYVTAPMPQNYTAAELADALKKQLTKDEYRLVKNPLASTPEMDRWAGELTAGATNDLQKARMLFDKLTRHINSSKIESTRAATEVFEDWQKPDQRFVCTEYANLYVALARAVGLKSFWVHVIEDVDGVKVLHACAGVYMGDNCLLVDPAYNWFGVPHKKFTVQDDIQTVAYHLSQNYQDVAAVRLACKLAPDSSVAQFNLFFRLAENSDWSGASEMMTNVLKLDPESAFAWCVRGEWALHEGKLDQALVDLQKAVKLDSTQGGWLLVIAQIYIDQGKLKEAREYLRGAEHCGLKEENLKNVQQAIAKINEAIGSGQPLSNSM
jgi:tetratricopeptide (TPR) repeat protein